MRKYKYITANCQVCGKEFSRTESDTRRKFCSEECRKVNGYRLRVKRMVENDLPQRSVKNCVYCGKEFMQKSPRQRFCCDPCRISFCNEKVPHAPKTEATCDFCGKTFLTSTNAVFCSEECRTKGKNARHRRLKQEKVKTDTYAPTLSIAKKQKKSENALSIEKAAKEARSKGMTYGECFAPAVEVKFPWA